MNDKDMNELYQQSLLCNKSAELVYFGRWTSMKDPHRLFDYKELDPSMSFKMIGVERSIGAYYDIFKNPLCDPMKLGFIDNIDQYYNANVDSTKVGVFPPINRDVALEILSRTLFGCSFYRLKENKINNLGNRMEFTQIEMSCVCLPVFDIEWGKNTYDMVTGKTFYELGNNAIYSDKNDLRSSLNEMKFLAQNTKEYNMRRENIYDLVKRNYGSTSNIKYFYETITNIGSNL